MARNYMHTGYLQVGARYLDLGHSLCVQEVNTLVMLCTSAGAYEQWQFKYLIRIKFQKLAHFFTKQPFLQAAFARSYQSKCDVHTQNRKMIVCIHYKYCYTISGQSYQEHWF